MTPPEGFLRRDHSQHLPTFTPDYKTPDYKTSALRGAWAGGVGMITGRTKVIAHLGFRTKAFKATMIYNPWFEQQGIEAVVVLMGVEAKDYPDLLRSLFRITNLHEALVTMPHKVTTRLVDELTTTAMIPAYLELFGFGTSMPDQLRALAQLRY